MWVAETVQWAVPQKSEWVGGALVKAGDPGWGAGPGGLPVIPSPRQGRHDGVRGVYWPAGSIRGATTPGIGGHDLHDPRRPGKSRRRCSCHPRQMFQGAYVTVTQRVEDDLQLTPSGSDRSDVAASAVGDAFSQHPDLAGFGDGLDRLDRGPTDQT